MEKEKLEKSEEFVEKIIEIASEKALTYEEFAHSLCLVRDIINRNTISKQCLAGYKFPSQVQPPDINDSFSGLK